MITKIISRKNLSEQLIKLEINISNTFSLAGPGQYVVLRSLPGEVSVALPVIKSEPGRETLTVLAQTGTTKTDASLDLFLSGTAVELEGPLGQPFVVENFSSVFCVAGYDCMIPLLPIIQALRMAGNKITCLLTQNQGTNPVIETEIRKNTDHWVATDENQRRSAQLLEQILRAQKFDQVIAIGKTRIIREANAICTSTQTPVQSMLFFNELNYQGKQGIFRVNVCSKSHSICVDGHNFNGHYLSFDDIAKRFECASASSRIQENQLTTL